MMRDSLQDSANTSSVAWPRRCAGSCGWAACPPTSRAESPTSKQPLSMDTTLRHLHESCWPLLTYAKKRDLRRFNYWPTSAAIFPVTHFSRARLRALNRTRTIVRLSSLHRKCTYGELVEDIPS